MLFSYYKSKRKITRRTAPGRCGRHAGKIKKERLLLEDADRAGMKKRFDEFEAFLDEQTMGITDYDEVMVRQLIKKTTLFDDRLFFEFMAGIEIEVQI